MAAPRVLVTSRRAWTALEASPLLCHGTRGPRSMDCPSVCLAQAPSPGLFAGRARDDSARASRGEDWDVLRGAGGRQEHAPGLARLSRRASGLRASPSLALLSRRGQASPRLASLLRPGAGRDRHASFASWQGGAPGEAAAPTSRRRAQGTSPAASPRGAVPAGARGSQHQEQSQSQQEQQQQQQQQLADITGTGSTGRGSSGRGRGEEAPVCPGCGVDMQSSAPSAPGYFVLPAVRPAQAALGDEEGEEAAEEEEEEGMAGLEGAGPEAGGQGSGWVEFDLRRRESRALPEGAQGQLGADGGPAEFLGGLDDDDLDEMEEALGAGAPGGGPDDMDAADAWDRMWAAEEKKDRRGGAKQRQQERGRGEAASAEEASQRLVVCARCHALRHYGRVKDESAENLLPDFDFERVVGQRLRTAYGRRAVVLLVVDAADFDGSFPRSAARILAEAEAQVGQAWQAGEAGNAFRLLVVANKCDLLPKQVSWMRLAQWVRRRARAGGAPRVSAVHLVSAQTQWGVAALVQEVQRMAGPRGDVWVIGSQNAGKSSLINALARVASRGRQSAQLTEASVLGTTVGVVALEGLLGARTRVMDTPGLLQPHQLTTRLSRAEQALVQPRKHLKPRTYRIAAGQSILVGGLARVDVVSAPSQTIYLTVWASAYLTCHLGRTENVDAILDRHLGGMLQPPVASEALREVGPGRWVPRTVSVAGEQWDHSSSDVSIAGLGWLGVGVKGEAVLQVWAPEGVAVAVREAMVFDMARTFERPGFSVSPLPNPGASSSPAARVRASPGGEPGRGATARTGPTARGRPKERD